MKQNNKTVKFVNKSPNPNPFYDDSGASGFELLAWIKSGEAFVSKDSILLAPLERRLIHTGIYVELPEDVELQVRPKSGRAIKEGLTVLNTPGTVDSNYRGEICVIIINLSNETRVISNGEKIAQAVICPVFNCQSVTLEQIDEIDTNTERGEGGFGHNGIR